MRRRRFSALLLLALTGTAGLPHSTATAQTALPPSSPPATSTGAGNLPDVGGTPQTSDQPSFQGTPDQGNASIQSTAAMATVTVVTAMPVTAKARATVSPTAARATQPDRATVARATVADTGRPVTLRSTDMVTAGTAAVSTAATATGRSALISSGRTASNRLRQPTNERAACGPPFLRPEPATWSRCHSGAETCATEVIRFSPSPCPAKHHATLARRGGILGSDTCGVGGSLRCSSWL